MVDIAKKTQSSCVFGNAKKPSQEEAKLQLFSNIKKEIYEENLHIYFENNTIILDSASIILTKYLPNNWWKNWFYSTSSIPSGSHLVYNGTIKINYFINSFLSDAWNDVPFRMQPWKNLAIAVKDEITCTKSNIVKVFLSSTKCKPPERYIAKMKCKWSFLVWYQSEQLPKSV